MIEDRIRNLLKMITYKPGWHLEIPPWRYKPRNEWDSVPIMMRFLTKDIETGKDIELCMQETIGPFFRDDIDDVHLIEIIAGIIRKFEEHEFREWFKVDGFQVYEPHPERKYEEKGQFIES